MSSGSEFGLFATSLKTRVTDPRVVSLQLAVIVGTVLAVGRPGPISESNQVLALVAIPGLLLLALFLPVGVVHSVTLRIEEEAKEDDERTSCWLSITDRLLLWINAAFLVPILIWGVPITGTLGYTTEALGPLVLGEQIAGDHSLGAIVVMSAVLVGSAWATLGYLSALKAYLGPSLAEDRIQMYLGLRSLLPSNGRESVLPLGNGGQTYIDTKQLADACVEFTLTQLVPDDVPDSVDIQWIVDHADPRQASVPALFIFHATMNRRFLSVLFGSMLFVIAATFGVAIESISWLTVALGTALGVLSQVAVDHPFISAASVVRP